MITRRKFIHTTSGAVVGAMAAGGCAVSHPQSASQRPLTAEEEMIRLGAKMALEKSLFPALRERAYPGHFTVTVDGRGYGEENTWPGLDSWEIAGALLLAGRSREVLDYFDFVQASQRSDGNIPFAIFPGDQSPGSTDSWLRGLRFPQDVYTYKPAVRAGQPSYSNMTERKWIGLFTHWQVTVNPLSVLGAASYVLTAAEIYAALKSDAWLADKMPSLNAAGGYLLSRITPNGLMSGAGFYVESPPRNQWDGITQCYGIYVFRLLADLNRKLQSRSTAAQWSRRAENLQARFLEVFWQRDHFAEYVHPERGIVDSHGLSDVNWAAIGLGVATDRQAKTLWPILTSNSAFWHGDLPTQLVTRPKTYEKWEYAEPLPFPYSSWTQDVAAMGRVWYLEGLACRRMGDHRRLRDSVLNVCQLGQRNDWLWFERYHAAADNIVKPVGAAAYCEYAAVLIRIVLGNPNIFPEARSVTASPRDKTVG